MAQTANIPTRRRRRRRPRRRRVPARRGVRHRQEAQPPGGPTGRTSRSTLEDGVRRRPRRSPPRCRAATIGGRPRTAPFDRSHRATTSPVATDIRNVASTPGSRRIVAISSRSVGWSTRQAGRRRHHGNARHGNRRHHRVRGDTSGRAVALGVDAWPEHVTGSAMPPSAAAPPRRSSTWRGAGRRGRGASSRTRRSRRAASAHGGAIRSVLASTMSTTWARAQSRFS